MTASDQTSPGTGGAKARHRFAQKAGDAGFHSASGMRHDQLARFALQTMALVWPLKALAFEQVLVRHRRVEDLAEERGVNEKTIRRDLEGYTIDSERRELGAEDWFLIFLELFREGDCCTPGGAELLYESFLATQTTLSVIRPFHASFGLMALKCLVGGDEASILWNLPWLDDDAERTVAWPSHGQPAPLARSWLPGLIAGLRSVHGDDRFWFGWLNAHLATADGLVSAWEPLIALMTGIGRTGETQLDKRAALTRASELLESGPVERRAAMLGILACSELPWEHLAPRAGRPHLKGRPRTGRVTLCAHDYVQSLGPR